MDYIGFVDSADIAEHMREIAYEPTGFEAAFLVWRSAYKSLEEKNQAWRQIINDFPDEELERERLGLKLRLHSFLQEYMELQKKKLACFFESESCVYKYSWRYKEFRRNVADSGFEADDSLFFATVEECRDHIEQQELLERAEGVFDEKAMYFIDKVPLGASSGAVPGTIVLNEGFEPVRVDVRGACCDEDLDIDLSFEAMWFAFPTPFRRGDILTLVDDANQIFVLDSLCTWDNAAMRENDLPDRMPYTRRDASKMQSHLHKLGDTSDMSACVYSLAENFELCRSHGGWPDYLDLEYYRGPDTDEVKGLKAVACYMRNKCDVSLLMDYLEFLESKHRTRALRFAEESFEKYIFPRREDER